MGEGQLAAKTNPSETLNQSGKAIIPKKIEG
jgi:hypothetical protein